MGGPACADAHMGPSALTTWAFCLGGKPTAGSRQQRCSSPRISLGLLWKWFSPCISCTGAQHLSAGDPLVLHAFTCTEHIAWEMGCTKQHILPCDRRKRYPKTHPLGWPGAILTEAGAQPGFTPCLLPIPMPGLNLPWGMAHVPRAPVWATF